MVTISNKEIGIDLHQTPLKSTANAATSPGKLMRTGRLAKEAALDRKLLESLKVKQAGTLRIEVKAWQLAMDARKKPGDNKESPQFKSKVDQIRQERDPSKVTDVLNLKIKYSKELEDKRRADYKAEKKQLEQTRKGNSGRSLPGFPPRTRTDGTNKTKIENSGLKN